MPNSFTNRLNMDILDLQQRLTDFMISQATSGPGNTVEADALRKELDAAIATFGDQIPQLQELADALDMMQKIASNPEFAQAMSEQTMKDYVPNPDIFDAIDDADVAAVEAALADWEINQTHGEFASTALYHAMSCMFGVSLPIVNLLLDRGADPRLGLGTSNNVLHGLGFGQCGDLQADELADGIKRCVSLGADLEQRTEKLKWTPLITAASEWNPVAVEALLLAGADINARAGDVEGVCFAGAPAQDFADGHEPTCAVFRRFAKAV